MAHGARDHLTGVDQPDGKIHAIGFHPFGINDVVDHASQPLAVFLGNFEHAACFIGYCPGQPATHQSKRALHGRQRCAQFVAHRGDKFVLDPFEILELGDVTEKSEIAERRPILVKVGNEVGRQVFVLAIDQMNQFELKIKRRAGQRRLGLAFEQITAGRAKQGRQVQAGHAVAGTAEPAREGGVVIEQGIVHAGIGNHGGDDIGRGGELPLGLLDHGFSLTPRQLIALDQDEHPHLHGGGENDREQNMPLRLLDLTDKNFLADRLTRQFNTAVALQQPLIPIARCAQRRRGGWSAHGMIRQNIHLGDKTLGRQLNGTQRFGELGPQLLTAQGCSQQLEIRAELLHLIFGAIRGQAGGTIVFQCACGTLQMGIRLRQTRQGHASHRLGVGRLQGLLDVVLDQQSGQQHYQHGREQREKNARAHANDVARQQARKDTMPCRSRRSPACALKHA